HAGPLEGRRAPARAQLALRRGPQLGRRHARHVIFTSLLSAPMDRIDRYAELITRIGANVQPGQTVYVTALVEHAPLARALARSGYASGARLVDVRYVDQHVRRSFIEHVGEETLSESPPWVMART